ncbi:unnamed protein product, partial [Closterium sp. NIES-54]
TSGMGLVLGGRGPVVLTGHADASWADDSATQRSSQGYTFSLGSGSVSWRSTRSSSVLSSCCEAEIYEGAMAAQELRWLTYLQTDFGEQPRSPPILLCGDFVIHPELALLFLTGLVTTYLLDKSVIVYLDDILIFSRTRKQHLRDLDAVFKRLQENQVITKGSKCDFFKRELEFFGYVISHDGIKSDPAKIKTIQEFSGVRELCKVVYPEYGKDNRPANRPIAQGQEFCVGEGGRGGFSGVEGFYCFPSGPALRRPIEAVRSQHRRLRFCHRICTPLGFRERAAANRLRVLQAAVSRAQLPDTRQGDVRYYTRAQLWRCYLVGADVTVCTDHKSLQYLRAQPNLNPRQVRWLDYMESHFTYRITYK